MQISAWPPRSWFCLCLPFNHHHALLPLSLLSHWGFLFHLTSEICWFLLHGLPFTWLFPCLVLSSHQWLNSSTIKELKTCLKSIWSALSFSSHYFFMFLLWQCHHSLICLCAWCLFLLWEFELQDDRNFVSHSPWKCQAHSRKLRAGLQTPKGWYRV